MNSPSIKKPVWISHRGFTATAVENTRRAFQAAVDIGFSFLETDLRLTKDRQIVLIHDKTLARPAKDPRRVRDMTRRELESVRLANNDRFLFFDAFVEAFDLCRWTLDIKPEGGRETIFALAEWVQQNNFEHRLARQTKFLTWTAGHEKLLKSVFPWAECYARKRECVRAGIAMIAGVPGSGAIKPGRTYALPPFFGKISFFKESVVRVFHQRNAKTIAFLPETDFLAQQAVRAGFDEILTNGKIISY